MSPFEGKNGMLNQLREVSSRAYGLLKGRAQAAVEPRPVWEPRNQVQDVETHLVEESFGADQVELAAAAQYFEKYGFVRLRNAVDVKDCEEVVAAIFAFLQMSRSDPEGWYRSDRPAYGMVELYQHPAMWRIRESAAIHSISSLVLGTSHLWTSMDRMNFKTPVHPRHPSHDSPAFIHWDMDSSNLPPIRFLQGVVMLEDTDETMGGFQCVPGLFGENLKQWIAMQPADRDPFFPDLNTIPAGMGVVVVPARAGDYIVWDSTLAHGSGRNVSPRPRFAQYVSQSLIPEGEERERQRGPRIEAYRQRTCVPFEHHRGDPTGWERRNYPPPPLTEHGEKLLGLRDW